MNWALTKKKLSPDMVKIYLSDLKMAHKIRSVEPNFENDFFIKAMLKGAKNVSLYANITKKSKFVMSFPLLKIIGHEIALSTWPEDSKLVFWSACCVVFFGSFRLGEILPKSDNNLENLTWSQIRFTNMRSVVINIRFPKVIRNNTGDPHVYVHCIQLIQYDNESCFHWALHPLLPQMSWQLQSMKPATSYRTRHLGQLHPGTRLRPHPIWCPATTWQP